MIALNHPFIRIFPCKLSIWGYPHFWNPPYESYHMFHTVVSVWQPHGAPGLRFPAAGSHGASEEESEAENTLDVDEMLEIH